MKKLVKHAEDLSRALKVLETLKDSDTMKNGFEMILQNFNKILEEEGVKPMNCEGEKFDPFKQEALLVEERDGTAARRYRQQGARRIYSYPLR